jgi:hypothetical protein
MYGRSAAPNRELSVPEIVLQVLKSGAVWGGGYPLPLPIYFSMSYSQLTPQIFLNIALRVKEYKQST